MQIKTYQWHAAAYLDLIAAEKASGKAKYSTQAATSITDD